MVRTIVWLLALGVTQAAWAQGLPTEPLTFGDGRLIVGGEVTATIAPEDLGFFNYTDYEYSTLRNLRIGVSAQLRANERVHVLGEVRVDQGHEVHPYALYVRIRPWVTRRLSVQVGRVPPTFGAFGRGAYGASNLLIGYPLAYQYLTSLRADALPASADDLFRMRGRGWLSSFPLGNTEPGPGLPVINAFRWDTGVQVHGANTVIEWTGAMTTGTLSNPRVDDDNDGRQLAGRVVTHVTPGFALGVSAARGAYADRQLGGVLPAGRDVKDGVQNAVAVDAEYSIDRFLARGEIISSRWTLPNGVVSDSLKATSVLGEARYRIWPGFHVAGRAERLGFNRITSATRTDAWDAPVRRFEVGVSWSVIRNVTFKASWQRNRRAAGRVQRETLGAAQLVYWF